MDIRLLINDVKDYLESLSNEDLTPRAEASRLRLLEKLSVSHSPPPAYYIDMTKTNSLSKSKEKVWSESSYEVMCGGGPPPVYSNTMPDVLTTSKRLSASLHPEENSSSSNNRTSGERRTMPVVSGPLMRRKRRRPSFLPNQVIHYWAAITASTLHLYQASKQSKPAVVIDLHGYQARTVIPNPKNDFAFEIFSPGRKTYQFVASNLEEQEGWVSAVCLEGGSDKTRQLPEPPPSQDHYDVPDSRVRPVLYQPHYALVSPNQEHLYKNVDDLNSDNTYYNIVGSARECKVEDIYQTIGEQRKEDSEEEIKETEVKKSQRVSGGRVQQIVKAMEGHDGRELYEPVDSDRLAR